MALKAVHVSDVPNASSSPLYSAAAFSQSVEMVGKVAYKPPKFLVVGHRGSGMNVLQSSDRRLTAVKENSIVSFNAAAKYPVDFIEFDVQVTKDGCPVIFHDDFILSQQNGVTVEKRVTDLSLGEFLSYGPQKGTDKTGKPLLRKTKDGGGVYMWAVETDDALCTLQEAFEGVNCVLGFNIELKFDDYVVYQQDHLVRVLRDVLEVVIAHAKDRPIIFSSFHPDAALLVKKLQSVYPVFFLTNGGTEVYDDPRRNSLEAAMKVCLEGGLEGIVSEVKAIFRNPAAVNKIKESDLSLLTYGKLNNVVEAVYMQHMMGIDGVIVDFVEEIGGAVWEMLKPSKEEEEEELMKGEAVQKPKFSQRELTFLLKLIPQLIQQ
ncbi:PREDICTED: glycerophosphodiester phosphodiesterase GDPD1, chloroplastic-like [Ipomoea nil]|uniref:glycerophosphodiester phosphodiesterase GDPD1, chloroplastic-like n=1 Tax=Ipomoea nil TaxID=35883 RepID=UPI000900953A|nr:PREDICTED: glycerophosphodiester phosphodiesterase GDPD1, chloroplastic-like [Ipomoea nil]